MIPCDVEIHGEVNDFPGEDYVSLTLPMVPQEGFWYDIVPAKGCARPGIDREYQVAWENTNTEDAFSGVSISLGPLPQGVTLASGAATFNLGTVAPGASGSESFTVHIADEWDFDVWGDHFKIDGTANAAEFEGTQVLDSIHDVWIGQLGITVTDPVAKLEYRGNRMPAAGYLSDCTDSLEPGDVTVYFTTQGNDADTGALITRTNDPIPLAGLSFDTEDAARLVALDNTISAVAETDEGFASDGPILAISVFHKIVHEIFDASLPRLGRYGLPSSGQKVRLDEWKVDYPEVSQDLALKRTDAVERLNLINEIGVIAEVVANAHYSEVVEGVEGVLSVWDLVALASMGVTQSSIQSNRILGGILGGQTGRLAALTGEGCDQLANRALPAVAKKIGLNKLLSAALQSRQMKKYLAQYSDDIVTQLYYSTKWQLCSGKLLKLSMRNLNSSTQQQQNMTYGVGEYSYTIPVDPIIQGGLEVLLQLIVEPFIHGSVAMGQDSMLGLNFGGSQDLALASGENTKQVLQTMSGIALMWGDLHDELHDVSVAARDSAMWIELIPLPAMQKAAGITWKVADVTGRVGAAMKVHDHAEFLMQLGAITAAGVQSVVDGNLDSFGYPVDSGHRPITLKAGADKAPKPARSTLSDDLIALYDQIEAAANAGDVTALADAAEVLVPLYRELTASETLLDIRADVLIDPPPGEFSDNLDVDALARDYQYAVLDTAMQRMALLRLMTALALGPDVELLANLHATLDKLRTLEPQTANAAQLLQTFVETIDLPDLPVMTLIDAPMAAETGMPVTISVMLADVGWNGNTTGTIELAIPEGFGEVHPAATQDVVITGGPATIQWQLIPANPGTYTEDFAIRLYDEDGAPIDIHTLIMNVDEAGARLNLEPGQGGTLATESGSASLVVPVNAIGGQGGDASLAAVNTVVIQLLPVEGIPPQVGVEFIGTARYLVLALDPDDITTVALEAEPTLTLRWNEGGVPGWIDPAKLKIMMAGNDGRWSALPTAIDSGERTAVAPIPGCGWYAIAAIDNEPPPAPEGLAADTSAGGLILTWQPVAAPDLAGYEIHVFEAGELVRAYGVLDPATTSFDVEDFQPVAQRRYAVCAVDAAGNTSAESDPVTIAIPAAGPLLRIRPIVDAIVAGGVALYDVKMTNTNSSPIDISLSLVEAPPRCAWRFEPAAMRLPPGSRRVFRLALGADATAPAGNHRFTIEATPGVSAIRLDSSLLITAATGHNLASYAVGGRIQGCSSPAAGAAGSPSLLIDENPDTAWRTGRGRVANEWIELTLAGANVYSIDRIIVRPTTGGDSPADFEIWVSDTTLDDDAFSTRVVAGRFGAEAAAQEFTFDAVPARHIRLKCLAAQPGSDLIELAELEVYGQSREQNGDWGMLMDNMLSRRQLEPGEQALCDFNGDGRLDVGDLVNLVNQTIEVFGL